MPKLSSHTQSQKSRYKVFSELWDFYTVIKRKHWYYHKFQWEKLKDGSCKTTCKNTNCSVWHRCAATDYFHVGVCGALWGFGLIALTSFRRSEGSINLKCCPHERSFKSLLTPEPQSPCGWWTCGNCREKIPNQFCCSGEETDNNCPWTHGILACVIEVQPHFSHLLPCLCCKY